MSDPADISAEAAGPVRSARRRDQVLASVDDPFARRALVVAYHLRRYVAAYVVLVAAALTVWLLPSVGGSNNVATGAGAGTGGAYGSGGSSGAPAAQSGSGNPALPSASGGAARGSTLPGSSGASGGGAVNSGGAVSGAVATGTGGSSSGTSPGNTSTSGPVGTVQVGGGTTRGGYACKPGVKQLPYSQYAAPCIAQFTGNNGGATWNGVTASTITVAIRHTSDSTGANAAAVDAEAEAAGGVTPGVGEQYTEALVNYFNHAFEL